VPRALTLLVVISTVQARRHVAHARQIFHMAAVQVSAVGREFARSIGQRERGISVVKDGQQRSNS